MTSSGSVTGKDWEKTSFPLESKLIKTGTENSMGTPSACAQSQHFNVKKKNCKKQKEMVVVEVIG
jgi:hypothetical protein